MSNVLLIEKKKNGKRVVELFNENLESIKRACGYTHSQLMSEINRKFEKKDVQDGFATLNGFKIHDSKNKFETCIGVELIEKTEIISILKNIKKKY